MTESLMRAVARQVWRGLGVLGRDLSAVLQLVPFTVSRARDAILFVAEWRFLVRDEGDPDPGGDPLSWGDTDPERDGIWKEDEEPQTCPWDSWTQGAVTVLDVSLPSEQVPSEDIPVTAEPGAPHVCPRRVPDAAPVPPGQAPSAAARAPPVPVPGAVAVLLTQRSGPEPPVTSRPPRRGSRVARTTRPRPAPPEPPAPPSAKPPEPPTPAPSLSRGARTEIGAQTSPFSRRSPASVQTRRPSRGVAVPISGVPRLGARRDAARWVTPEVKVVNVTTDPEWARSYWRGRGSDLAVSRCWQPTLRPQQVFPVAARTTRGQPQLCDPWLASAVLAPGVTVRWGGSERRGRGGPIGEQEDEAVKKAERELKPILRYPECRIGDDE
ncbi:uncharacterized protein C2orf81 homolog [Malurus melanocephalus]|uniref:uncharacterized protein C2orf81 homolog n=1 Tax=Malurus melanocephalus TaxID=175006 RepID=UPI002549014B|nr:uncharacterized protein C2orf81 homolog [Malurus melanocephalus]